MHALAGTGTGEDYRLSHMHAAEVFLGEREVIAPILKSKGQNSTTFPLPEKKY